VEVLVKRHAIFDLDGTLLDSAPVCAEILNTMLGSRGVAKTLTPGDAQPHVIHGGRSMVAALLGPHAGDPEADLAEFRERYRQTPTPPSSVYPGARDALFAIRDMGVTLGLWSNKPQDLCEKVLGEMALTALFSAIVGTGPDVPLKPDPTGFDRALRKSGGTRRRCVYVGDSVADYQAAHAVGVPFIMMSSGYGRFNAGWRNASLASSFRVLPKMVEALLSVEVDA
jgi:phosphoglycolate phosphatase